MKAKIRNVLAVPHRDDLDAAWKRVSESLNTQLAARDEDNARFKQELQHTTDVTIHARFTHFEQSVASDLESFDLRLQNMETVMTNALKNAGEREQLFVKQLNTNTEVLNVVRLTLPNVARAIAKFFEKRKRAAAAQANAQDVIDDMPSTDVIPLHPNGAAPDNAPETAELEGEPHGEG